MSGISHHIHAYANSGRLSGAFFGGSRAKDHAHLMGRIDPVLEGLPAHCNSVFAITGVLNKPIINLAEIAEIIRRDPSIVAQVLRMANQRAGCEIYRLENCIVLIGSRGLKEIVFKTMLFSSHRSPVDKELKALWHHSRRVAITGEYLARAYGLAEPEQAYVAGLLHDLGRAALLSAIECDEGTELQMSAEEESRAGSLLASFWGLPQFVIDVIENHHEPGLARYDRTLVSIVSAADRFCNEHQSEDLSSLCAKIDMADLVGQTNHSESKLPAAMQSRA